MLFIRKHQFCMYLTDLFTNGYFDPLFHSGFPFVFLSCNLELFDQFQGSKKVFCLSLKPCREYCWHWALQKVLSSLIFLILLRFNVYVTSTFLILVKGYCFNFWGTHCEYAYNKLLCLKKEKKNVFTVTVAFVILILS